MNPKSRLSLIISCVLSVVLWDVYPRIVIEVGIAIYINLEILLVINYSILDILIIGFIPFWIYLGYKWKPSMKRVFFMSVLFLGSLFVINFLGGYYAIESRDKDIFNSVAPVPFPYFWTCVNFLALSIAILPFKPWRKTQGNLKIEGSKESELLDD